LQENCFESEIVLEYDNQSFWICIGSRGLFC
jgi:hypothetical protein